MTPQEAGGWNGGSPAIASLSFVGLLTSLIRVFQRNWLVWLSLKPPIFKILLHACKLPSLARQKMLQTWQLTQGESCDAWLQLSSSSLQSLLVFLNNCWTTAPLFCVFGAFQTRSWDKLMVAPFSWLFLRWEDYYLLSSHVTVLTHKLGAPCLHVSKSALANYPFCPVRNVLCNCGGEINKREKFSIAVTILSDELSAVALVLPIDTACPVPPVSWPTLMA